MFKISCFLILVLLYLQKRNKEKNTNFFYAIITYKHTQKMRRLKQDVIEQIQSDNKIFLELCMKSNLKQSSLERQLDANSDKLTRYDLLVLLSQRFVLPIEDLLQDEV